jgi:hypothetical protein
VRQRAASEQRGFTGDRDPRVFEEHASKHDRISVTGKEIDEPDRHQTIMMPGEAPRATGPM